MVQRNGVWYEVGINSMASASHPMDQDKYAGESPSSPYI